MIQWTFELVGLDERLMITDKAGTYGEYLVFSPVLFSSLSYYIPGKLTYLAQVDAIYLSFFPVAVTKYLKWILYALQLRGKGILAVRSQGIPQSHRKRSSGLQPCSGQRFLQCNNSVPAGEDFPSKVATVLRSPGL